MVVDLFSIENKISNGQRISLSEAEYLWHNADDQSLVRLAQIVRGRFHSPDIATYVLMRIINYTNICVAKCDYCAFYELPVSKKGYLLSNEAIFSKIDELIDVGGELFAFNGGFNPALKIDYYVDLFSTIRRKYGHDIEFYAMTVVELLYVARMSGITVEETVARLKAAGVNWVTGGGAEILADQFRLRHSPQKYTVDEYYDTQRKIIAGGMNSTATMVIGFDESFEERLEHLDKLRQFQDSIDGKLFSFLCWTYKPYNTELSGEEISSGEYLRHLALCRIFLDNFKHIRTSVLTQNANALTGLKYGADDFDIPWEDEVTQTAGAVIEKDVDRILSYAEAEGYKSKLRKIAKAMKIGAI